MTAPDTDTLAGLLAEAMPAMDGLRRIKAEDWSVDMPGDGGWACVGREDNSPRIIVIERGWGKTADARQDAVERLCILSPTLAAEVISLRAQAAKDKARIERLEAALRKNRAEMLRIGANLPMKAVNAIPMNLLRAWTAAEYDALAALEDRE